MPKDKHVPVEEVLDAALEVSESLKGFANSAFGALSVFNPFSYRFFGARNVAQKAPTPLEIEAGRTASTTSKALTPLEIELLRYNTLRTQQNADLDAQARSHQRFRDDIAGLTEKLKREVDQFAFTEEAPEAAEKRQLLEEKVSRAKRTIGTLNLDAEFAALNEFLESYPEFHGAKVPSIEHVQAMTRAREEHHKEVMKRYTDLFTRIGDAICQFQQPEQSAQTSTSFRQ